MWADMSLMMVQPRWTWRFRPDSVPEDVSQASPCQGRGVSVIAGTVSGVGCCWQVFSMKIWKRK